MKYLLITITLLSLLSCRLTKETIPTISKSVMKDSTIVLSHDTMFIHSNHDTIIDNKELFLSISSKSKGFDILYHIKPIQIEIPAVNQEKKSTRQSRRYEYKLNKLKLRYAHKEHVRDINSNLKIKKDSIKETNKTNRTQIKQTNKTTRRIEKPNVFGHRIYATIVGFIIGFIIGKYFKYIVGLIKITTILFITTYGYSQSVDTVITKQSNYKSYISYQYIAPLYVKYKLYKGGGDCGRKNDNFINDTRVSCGTDSDYKASGYDKGHLASAEDFAYDCKLQEATFRYYNCIPQTPNLNRGIWKVWEDRIRTESQSDSLMVICGSKYGKKKIGKIYVPAYCFKIVKSLSTGKVTHVLWFTNQEKENTVQEITIEQLFDKKHLGYRIDL